MPQMPVVTTRMNANTNATMPSSDSRRKTTTSTIGILCCSVLLVLLPTVSGWVVPKPTSSSKTTTTTTPSSSSSVPSNTLFYKSGTDDETDTTTALSSPTSSKPIVQQLQQLQELEREERLSKAATIPWLQGQEEIGNDDIESHVFLPHWNWQLDYFREHLTNLRVNEPSTNNNDDDTSDDADLYCLDDGTRRMYTISLSSDEYRDIRVTYMDFPSCKTFRCLAYPSDAAIPILGMGLMKFGKHQHLAVLDYQPLGDSASDDSHNDDTNDAFCSELLRMRAEIPTMSQPHTYRHFVTEERKYFTDYPLLGKYNNKKDNASDDKAWFRELQRGQRDFVETHVRLTQGQSSEQRTGGNNNDVVRIHSDFDTHVSRKEPAGPMLVATYGPEMAHQLVHEVIFPLSRNTQQQAAAAATAAEERPLQSQ